MISQLLYHVLCRNIHGGGTALEGELEQFLRPYVLVIHQPSGRGFYLDRQYRHIVDIKNCQEPKNPTKVARHQLSSYDDLPAWALQIDSLGLRREEFDSFWLY